jgi:hypothetical protein
MRFASLPAGVVVASMALLGGVSAPAQPPAANYDEAMVPTYRLPDPLTLVDGSPVSDAETWRERRRGEILELFREHVYGRAPEAAELRHEVLEGPAEALEGLATRTQARVFFAEGSAAPAMDLLLYVPRRAKGPVAVFLALNFGGNHTVHRDPAIRLPRGWVPERRGAVTRDHRATEADRGAAASRWPIETILERGYALATVYYGDIDPDFDDGFRNGVHALFDGDGPRAPDAWGSVAAWAWGLSRALDYLETDERIDARRAAVLGHSRLGKTALWAGAQDERFAMVISNESGCGGAALSRRRFGETVAHINAAFPHWFCQGFERYGANEDALPVDQHMLIALIAPRPVYVASAEEDRWADPRGEFLAAKHATAVYELLGAKGLVAETMPAVGEPLVSTIGYHIRSGPHDLTDYDWRQYLDFADRHLIPAPAR